jgi:hypothetical protein
MATVLDLILADVNSRTTLYTGHGTAWKVCNGVTCIIFTRTHTGWEATSAHPDTLTNTATGSGDSWGGNIGGYFDNGYLELFCSPGYCGSVGVGDIRAL